MDEQYRTGADILGDAPALSAVIKVMLIFSAVMFSFAFLYGLWMVWESKRARTSGDFVQENPNEGRIVYITGWLGSGKTAYAVMRAEKFAKQGLSGKLPIYSNAVHELRNAEGGYDVRPMKEGWNILRNWQDLQALVLDDFGQHPGVIVLDEIHLWLSSATTLMDKDDLREAAELLSYARKRGWVVLATSQGRLKVHTSFRELVTEYVQAKPYIKGRLHRVILADIDTGRPIAGVAYSLYSPRRAKYNTRAEVTPLWSLRKEKERDIATTSEKLAARRSVPASRRSTGKASISFSTSEVTPPAFVEAQPYQELTQ